MLYSASSRFSSTSRRCRSRSVWEGSGTIASPRNQEPDERQPQLARERHRAIVDEHLGRIVAADDLEQVAQPGGVARPEARAIASRRVVATLSKFGGLLRQLQRSRKIWHVERWKH